MLCALRLAESGKKEVALIERNDRLGKKLSSTGNGQGNITNNYFGGEHYFTDEPQKVEGVLQKFTDQDLLTYLERKGGLFCADERGRVYPTGRQASAVTDLLRFALVRAGVETVFGCKIERIKRQDKGFVLQSDKREFFTDVLVLATGGKAAKNFGTDGAGYDFARALGHTVTPLYPALVQLKTDMGAIKGLRGVRTDCLARAVSEGKELAVSRGDVIFTDYGVSGNVVFSLSSYLTDRTGELVFDFLPDVTKERLVHALQGKQGCEKSELLGCILNNQLGRAIVRRAERTHRDDPCGIADLVKAFPLKVVGSLGFDYAQVTRGGVPMSEVNEDLQSKKAKNCYLCGEILNVDGECGGYNLQWAFSSAVCVAESILRQEKGGERA